jgi:hypothetical protein
LWEYWEKLSIGGMPKNPDQSGRASFVGSLFIAERYFEPASPDPLKTVAWELLLRS